MITNINRILVCCSHSVTGGTEALHQLVHVLRLAGHDAAIVYLPFGVPFQCAERFRIYDAPSSELVDARDVLIVVPEVATRLVRSVRQARTAIWWLSVDNYFSMTGESAFLDLIRRYRSLFNCRVPLSELRGCHHFVQSEYAAEFLRKAGIDSSPLSDYLGSQHLSNPVTAVGEKRDMVVYNPKKGQRETARLRDANPDLEFVPIQNMTPRDVTELLFEAKLYVDFGHHPGKDRLPREAVLAGCCIVTGRRGAARNTIDIPIPESYKLDESRREFVDNFRERVGSIFKDFEKHSQRFDPYRKRIRGEPLEFERQVRQLFGTRPK